MTGENPIDPRHRLSVGRAPTVSLICINPPEGEPPLNSEWATALD
jgi:hypothetical protein